MKYVVLLLAVSAAAALAAEPQNWKGDISGVWQGPYTPDLTRGTDAVMTPWGEDKFKSFDGKMDPCLPVGITRLANAPDPVEIVQSPNKVAILYESWHSFRSIPTNGVNKPVNPDPTWLGTSAGHWDGDTFIVEVTKLNDKTALDTNGHPHSDQLHLTEKFRRTGPLTMSYEVTVDDPKAYTKPWTQSRVFKLQPGLQLMEYVCLENEKDRSHLIGVKQ